MDFKLTDEQHDLVAAARQFATEKLLLPSAGDVDPPAPVEPDAIWRTMWEESAAAGYAGLPLPEPAGGRGLSLMDSMLVFEAMAGVGADPGFLFSLGVHQFAAAISVAHIGTPQQKEAWLKPLAAGTSIGALAVSEEGAGSDSYAMAACATETTAGFAISGRKIWISNAPIADLFLICARTDDIPGAFGISCFLVPRDAKRLHVENGPQKSGLKGAPWGSLQMQDVAVTQDDMLGGRGGGAAVFRDSMRWERCGLFAIVLGAMRKSLADCLTHVANRQQFGRPLVDNSTVAKTIALMQTRAEAARLLLYKAAASIDDGRADDGSISLAKAYVSEAAVTNALAAQELYGAAGVLSDSAATTFLNDMLPFRVLSGPTELASNCLPTGASAIDSLGIDTTGSRSISSSLLAVYTWYIRC